MFVYITSTKRDNSFLSFGGLHQLLDRNLVDAYVKHDAWTMKTRDKFLFVDV